MKKIILSSMIMLLFFTSCENYIDVNEDQSNKPLFDAIAPNQMLAGAINNYTFHQVSTLATFGNRMTYVWGLNSGFTSTDPAYTYVFDSSSYQANFETTYIFAANFQDILDKKDAFPDYDYHFGIAKLFKVMSFDYLTAMYGDVPYSEAFKNDIKSPKYDDDKLIIAGLFKELDEAKAYFNSTTAVELGKEDIVFGGDVAEWKKFLNTVELRLLMRLSKTTDATLVALRTARFASLDKNFITADITVNPGYFDGVQTQRSPTYRTYGLNEAKSDWTSANRANAAGDFIGDIVNGELADANITSTGIVDPRRGRMFTLVGGKVVGNVQGIFPLTAISRVSNTYIGRVGGVPGGNSGDTNGIIKDAFLMLAAESHFLQAEAIERGYLAGSALAEFNAGVKASFDFYSTPWGDLTPTQFPAINTTSYTNYIAAIAGKNGLDYTGSADKINAIITQKYLALAEWSGLELFIDQRRTGFPNSPIPVGASKSTRPNRLIYPSSEYSTNSNNVPNVTNDELFTVNAKTPYYLQ
jgi:hypothetical protein